MYARETRQGPAILPTPQSSGTRHRDSRKGSDESGDSGKGTKKRRKTRHNLPQSTSTQSTPKPDKGKSRAVDCDTTNKATSNGVSSDSGSSKFDTSDDDTFVDDESNDGSDESLTPRSSPLGRRRSSHQRRRQVGSSLKSARTSSPPATPCKGSKAPRPKRPLEDLSDNVRRVRHQALPPSQSQNLTTAISAGGQENTLSRTADPHSGLAVELEALIKQTIEATLGRPATGDTNVPAPAAPRPQPNIDHEQDAMIINIAKNPSRSERYFLAPFAFTAKGRLRRTYKRLFRDGQGLNPFTQREINWLL